MIVIEDIVLKQNSYNAVNEFYIQLAEDVKLRMIQLDLKV